MRSDLKTPKQHRTYVSGWEGLQNCTRVWACDIDPQTYSSTGQPAHPYMYTGVKHYKSFSVTAGKVSLQENAMGFCSNDSVHNDDLIATLEMSVDM